MCADAAETKQHRAAAFMSKLVRIVADEVCSAPKGQIDLK